MARKILEIRAYMECPGHPFLPSPSPGLDWVDKLHTAVVEVESIINSRPLTYLSPSDLEEPLSPSHIIAGKCHQSTGQPKLPGSPG